ncbi:hypothetical protein SLS54_005061 [Diplodia seriata]
MKEHLYRKHSLPEHHCYLCYEPFSDRQALLDHLSPLQGGSQCSGPQRKPGMFLSTAQERQLRQRSERVPEVEKWKKIFCMLFEKDGEEITSIPSPYVDEYGLNFSEVDREVVRQFQNRVDIEAESILSDFMDQAQRQISSGAPSAVLELHIQQAPAHVYAEVLQRLYRPVPDANPGDLPSHLFPLATPSSRRQAPDGTNSFGPTWPPLDATGGLNNDLGPHWSQRHWDQGFGVLDPIEELENDTPVSPSTLQTGDGVYSNMELDNKYAPGVLQGGNRSISHEAPSSGLNPGNSHGMAAYPLQNVSGAAHDVDSNDESILSIIDTGLPEYDTWSSNQHDTEWGGTQATTMDGYRIQTEKTDALQEKKTVSKPS